MLILSFIIISILGSILHFTYDLSNHNKIVGIFSSVNESTWEHIKIGLTATFIWSLIDGFIYGNMPNYFFSKFISIISIIILIPILFYGFKCIFKKSILLVDILIFYVVIFISQYLFYYLLNIEDVSYVVSYISLIGIIVIFACYLLLSIYPIKSFLFKDPITNKYGFEGHNK